MKKAVDRKLTGAAAPKIGEAPGVSYADVGAVADEPGMKIKNCQLGCF